MLIETVRAFTRPLKGRVKRGNPLTIG